MNTDRENLRRLMRALRKKGVFARMGFHYTYAVAHRKAVWECKPGQPYVFCTKGDLGHAINPDDQMCRNNLWLTVNVCLPAGMAVFGEKHDQAVRGVAHLVLTTAEELGITNINWDEDAGAGSDVSMDPRPEYLGARGDITQDWEPADSPTKQLCRLGSKRIVNEKEEMGNRLSH